MEETEKIISDEGEKIRINHSEIESKWQQKWLDSGIWKTKRDKNKRKFLMHFAYPGVSGYQHVGHMRGFSYTDMICRYKRMTGHNVFYPIGVHASGNQALGFAKKVERKDETWISYLLANGYPKDEIEKMKDVNFVVNYFIENYKENWQKFGFLADWNSLTCTIWPDYGKFIEWQFMKLKNKNYLIQEPYIATFCPNCGPIAVDPSETDISKGGHAEKHEYTLLKFKLNDEYLVAATLRPETVYGQTNLWVDPNENYSKIKIENEIWICSKECALKLKNQKENVEVLNEKIKGTELIGKYATAPGVNRSIVILPSSFTDANVGTGIVTSVPSDAPYDWMALKDLQENNEEMKKYNLDVEKIKSIKVIPIINSKDYGDTPALKICADMNIMNQNDPKLEEATKIIYKMGFHTGILNNNCGEFSGMAVEKAKEKMKEKLINEKKADTMFDLSEEVICRCGQKVIIKKIPDQWFIKYSDYMWTQQSKEHAQQMKILPEEYAENISSVLDWYQNRACARLGNWLGTKLPFDNKWTVEPISDSTLYPAYYIISRYFNKGILQIDEMNEEFFDYIFLDEGKPKSETWQEIREEFEYWYPVDFNLGGKEHKTVHFPPYIMNHVAILNQKDWPQGIFVNWYVTGKGGKISKSKGGASASPTDAAKIYSVDGMRLYYAHSASPFVDVEWDEEAVLSYKAHVESIYSIVEKLNSMNSEEEKQIDKWMLSRLHSKLKQYHKLMNEYDLRKATSIMTFELMKDINHYIKRKGINKKTAMEIINILLKSLTPFIPHTCEECWEKVGNKTLISAEEIPMPNEVLISEKGEIAENIIIQLEEDIQNVMKLAKIDKPSKITLIIANQWKRNAWAKVKSIVDKRAIIPELMKDNEFKLNGQTALRYSQWLQKNQHNLGEILSEKEELDALNETSKSLSEFFNANVSIITADNTENPKAGNALPGKPAVLIE